MSFIDRMNTAVAHSYAGKWFKLADNGRIPGRSGSYFTTEVRAGMATFFAMAYIISVNASVISDSGGTCVCSGPENDPICERDTEYLLCKAEIKRDLVTATAAISALSTFMVGLLSNLPVGMAPGMGLNAYLAYNVVGFNGTGKVPYDVAMSAIFIEGFIFLGLTILGLRQWLARVIPHSLKVATSGGIGLFLTLIGLTYSSGIGLIVGGTSTPLELAGCKPALRDEAGLCPSYAKMRNPTLWIGIFCGGIFTTILSAYRVKGAVIMGILLVSIISWPRNTEVTYFPYTDLGNDAFDFFQKVVDFHPIRHTLNVLAWEPSSYNSQFGLALVTFLYVDILDTTGTLYSMARFAKLVDPVTRDFEGSSMAFSVDALSISLGSLLGVSPVTAFVESGAGIAEGGKTGITAMVTGLCFLVAVFFAPIFASIPPWATGCVLVLVGSMMTAEIVHVNWAYVGDAVPAFICIALMPFTYSIADGLIGGIVSYIIINTIIWVLETITRGKFRPPNREAKEEWTWRVPGGILPPWVQRLARGKKDFWRRDGIDTPIETPGHELRQSSTTVETTEKNSQ